MLTILFLAVYNDWKINSLFNFKKPTLSIFNNLQQRFDGGNCSWDILFPFFQEVFEFVLNSSFYKLLVRLRLRHLKFLMMLTEQHHCLNDTRIFQVFNIRAHALHKYKHTNKQ